MARREKQEEDKALLRWVKRHGYKYGVSPYTSLDTIPRDHPAVAGFIAGFRAALRAVRRDERSRAYANE